MKETFSCFLMVFVLSLGLDIYAGDFDLRCDTLQDCYRLQESVDALVKLREAQEIPPLGDIPLDEIFNTAILMSVEGGQEYCEAHDARLPTARQLANFYKKQGIQIRETSYPEERFLPGSQRTKEEVVEEVREMGLDGFFPIITRNANGIYVIDFYYNAKLFQPDDENSKPRESRRYWSDLYKHKLWSSSRKHWKFAYFFDLRTGRFEIDYASQSVATVRCVEIPLGGEETL